MISFLSRTIDFFFFFLSLWIYLWLAETSQQPISQTTWLKVTPHCNHFLTHLRSTSSFKNYVCTSSENCVSFIEIVCNALSVLNQQAHSD